MELRQQQLSRLGKANFFLVFCVILPLILGMLSCLSCLHDMLNHIHVVLYCIKYMLLTIVRPIYINDQYCSDISCDQFCNLIIIPALLSKFAELFRDGSTVIRGHKAVVHPCPVPFL